MIFDVQQSIPSVVYSSNDIKFHSSQTRNEMIRSNSFLLIILLFQLAELDFGHTHRQLYECECSLCQLHEGFLCISIQREWDALQRSKIIKLWTTHLEYASDTPRSPI